MVIFTNPAVEVTYTEWGKESVYSVARAYNKKYRVSKEAKENRKKIYDRWITENRDHKLEYMKEYYIKNREKRLAYNKEWRARKKEEKCSIINPQPD